MERRSFAATTLLTLAGILIWAGHLTLVYGFTALACARQFADVRIVGVGIVPLVVAAVTVLGWGAMALVFWSALHLIRSERADPAARFLGYLTALFALLGLIGVTWQGVPSLIIPACA